MSRPIHGQDPPLDIVIVASTGVRELLRDALASIRRHPPTGGCAVWVADNASTDGTAEMVKSEFPEVHLAELGANVGFCVANNHWIRRTTAPFVLLLNPDTELSENALDRMLAVMRARPDVGISGCRLIKRDGSFDHAAKRSFPTPLGALAHFTGVGRRARAAPRLAQYRAPELAEDGHGPVDAVNGAFMLVRREAIADVGMLDEGYPTPGMEDLDWCYRFARSGWTVWYEGRVTVLHVKGGATVKRSWGVQTRSVRHNLSFHRSMGRFYRKYYAGSNPPLDLAVYAAIVVKFLIAVAKRGALGGGRP